jgi:hypothetical protein
MARFSLHRFLVVGALALGGSSLAACGDDDDDNNDTTDTGMTDTGMTDTGMSDTGEDTGSSDTGEDTGTTDTGEDTGTTDTGGMDDMAYVRVVHASWDAPPVDVYVNGTAPAMDSPLAGLEFGENAPGTDTDDTYIALAPGDYDFDVVVAGEDAADNTVWSVDALTLDADTYYTVWAYGSATALLDDDESNDADALSVMATVDDLSDTDGGARVNALHAASGVGAVDIWVDGMRTFENLGLGMGLEETATLPLGTYTLALSGAGSDDVLVQYTATLPVAGLINVFAVGDPMSEDGVDLLALLPSGDSVVLDMDPRLRVFHMNEEAGQVDIYLDGSDTALIPDLDYKSATGYLWVAPGAYSFDIRTTDAAADSAPAAEVDNIELASGETATLVAYGNVAEFAALRLDDDLSAPTDGTVRLRVIHTAMGDAVATVDVLSLGTDGMYGEVVGDFAYGAVAGPVDIIGDAPVQFALDADQDDAADFAFYAAALPAGAIVDAFATIDADGVSLTGLTSSGLVVPIPASTTTKIRVLHGSTIANGAAPGGVDGYVAGDTSASLFTNLLFAEATGFLTPDAGAIGFDVYAAGATDAPALAIPELTYEAGLTYTLLAYDDGTSIGGLRILDNGVVGGVPGDDQIIVSATHAANGVGAVDVYLGETLLLEEFAFGATGTLGDAVNIGDAQIGIDADRDGTVDLSYDLTGAPAGVPYNLVVVNLTDAGGVQIWALGPEGNPVPFSAAD